MSKRKQVIAITIIILMVVLIPLYIRLLKRPLAKPLTATSYQHILGIGIAVDWFSYRNAHYWYFYWRSHGFSIPEMIREEGFKHVRIRVSWDVVSNETLLHEIREAVNDCLRAGLIPIVTYTAPRLRKGDLSNEAQKHFIQWWVSLARYLHDEPYTVAYDLIVESSGALRDKPELLNKLCNETIHEIRRIDPYRIIIVTAPYSSSPFALKYLNIRNDKYIIAEWHIYAGGPKQTNKEPFNKTLIKEAIQAALAWSNKTHIPTYMGAWRPNRIPKHHKTRLPDGAPKGIYPMSIALAFSKYMATQLCTHRIPFTVNADTLFINYKNHSWYPSQEQIIKTIINTCKNKEYTKTTK